MRLSTAMMLGDSLRTRDASVFVNPTTTPPCGCAIGGATLACGGTYTDHEKLWPWLLEAAPEHYGLRWATILGCHPDIGFLAVMNGVITFEQLVDFVRSIEPPEPEELAIPVEIHVSEAIPAR